jgi:hypothetical protein
MIRPPRCAIDEKHDYRAWSSSKQNRACSELVSGSDFEVPMSPPGEKATAGQDQTGKTKFSHPQLKKIPSFHCSLTMSKGNSRANGISKREPNNLPDCEDDQDIGHTSHPL